MTRYGVEISDITDMDQMYTLKAHTLALHDKLDKVLNPDIEGLSEAVHNAWWDEKKRQGVTDHPDMLPYADLTEEVKEYDRVTVRTVLTALLAEIQIGETEVECAHEWTLSVGGPIAEPGVTWCHKCLKIGETE